MDNDFRLDLAELARSIEEADIITILFPLLQKTLLIDTRYDVEDDPLVRLVPVVSGPEERLQTIRRMRPQFPNPERVAFIPWPKYASSLVRLGVYDTLRRRLEKTGRRTPVEALRTSLRELEQLERKEIVAVIQGQGYRTLWERRR
ncbi:MAG: hypothetical protein HY688_00530 [Chloroflexi bacterium]|nr:hypothetical protein [Chloroflexota bacterium]